MASRNPDLWLWLVLGITGYTSALIAHAQLVAVSAATQVTLEDKRHREILSQRTEDALKLETLDQLTGSANLDIRAAAVKIIAERATQGVALELMLRDIAGKDVERRDRALTALCYLRGRKALTPTYDMFKALIDCLCTWLPAAQRSEAGATKKIYRYRSQPERDALKVLGLLLQDDVTLALQAGIIFRWLPYCRFDHNDRSEARRKQAIQEMLKWEYDDVDMCTILNALVANEKAREELYSHGLLDGGVGEKEAYEDVWRVRNRETADGDDMLDSGPMMRRGRRVREESIEEQALRRRRREAMVLGQDGRAVEREDIIEQDNDLGDEDVEQRDTAGEATEAATEEDRTWWNWRPWSVLRAGLVEEF